MYWTLETRPPTLDEIVHQGAQRMAAVIEAVIERHSKEWKAEVVAITAAYTVECSLREHDDSLDALGYGLTTALHNKVERMLAQQQGLAAPGSLQALSTAAADGGWPGLWGTPVGLVGVVQHADL